MIGGVIEGCDAEAAVVFTDGSCLGNPGPCGAGACLSIPGSSDLVMLKQPVSSRGSILLGELVAMKMILQYLYRSKVQGRSRITRVHVLSDRQSAVGHLKLGWEASSQKTTILEIKEEMAKLEKADVQLQIAWTPGHAEIIGNKHADRLAKEAAQEAKEKCSSEISPMLALIYNESLAQGTVPDDWQQANVAPVFKKVRNKMLLIIDRCRLHASVAKP